ncbi:hypothetical protein D9M72_439810 [compost metagenome]
MAEEAGDAAEGEVGLAGDDGGNLVRAAVVMHDVEVQSQLVFQQAKVDVVIAGAGVGAHGDLSRLRLDRIEEFLDALVLAVFVNTDHHGVGGKGSDGREAAAVESCLLARIQIASQDRRDVGVAERESVRLGVGHIVQAHNLAAAFLVDHLDVGAQVFLHDGGHDAGENVVAGTCGGGHNPFDGGAGLREVGGFAGGAAVCLPATGGEGEGNSGGKGSGGQGNGFLHFASSFGATGVWDFFFSMEAMRGRTAPNRMATTMTPMRVRLMGPSINTP